MGIYEKSYNPVKWTLLEYVSPLGRGAIVDWRGDLKTAQRKADFDVFLRGMVKKSSWAYPEIGGLSGKHLKSFKELRWKSDGVPHRIGGYFSADNEFVMLIGWTHNAKKYDPSNAFETLQKRKKALQGREATLREYKIVTGQ